MWGNTDRTGRGWVATLVRVPAAVVAISVGACTPGVHVQHVKVSAAQPPASFATYRWNQRMMRDADLEQRAEPDYEDVIRAAVDTALQARGYRQQPDDGAAMIVAFLMTARYNVAAYSPQHVSDTLDERQEYGLRWRLPSGKGPVRAERRTPADQVTFLREGTLHIGAFTPDGAPIWHAMGHKVLDSRHSKDEHSAVLAAAVERIMRRFPRRD